MNPSLMRKTRASVVFSLKRGDGYRSDQRRVWDDIAEKSQTLGVNSPIMAMKDELYNVRIKISPAWSRSVGERIWHESRRIQKQVDGSIEIIFYVAGLDEIRQWIPSFDPEACTVERLRIGGKMAERTFVRNEKIEDDDLPVIAEKYHEFLKEHDS